MENEENREARRAEAVEELRAAFAELESGEGLTRLVGGHGIQSRVFAFAWSESALDISFRIPYGRVLSDEEVAWNRVVDEARYFHRRAAIPVTNIVLSTTIPGSEDGHFAIDAEGYTFSAPASRTVKGRRYVLSGYTLETWDGSAWGSPAAHDGETSCTLSDTTAKVRLTWRYARPEGEGRLVVYDVDDYVQDGLILHYDGIRNAGATAAHDPEALQWRNIAPGYENRWPMDRCSYVDSGSGYASVRNDATEGAWTDNGFAFTGKGYFAKWDDGDPFSVPTNFTMQVSATGAIAD